VTIFFLDVHTSYLTAKDGCYVHQYLLDGKWIQRVGASEDTTGDPCFKKIEELYNKDRLKVREFLALPLYKRDGSVFACLQIKLIDPA
jgi:hypothetical protein